MIGTLFWERAESRRLEFKESWPGGDKIARTAVAFANGAGGKIVFGVRNEPRLILGISDTVLFRLEEQAINHIVDRCAPAIVPEVYIQNVDGRSLLVVEIFPGSRKPYHLKARGPGDGTYVRLGSVNRKASAEVVAALERESSGVSFDQETRTDVNWEELDLHDFEVDYQRATGRSLDLAAYRKLGISIHARNDSVPTNTAVLLS